MAAAKNGPYPRKPRSFRFTLLTAALSSRSTRRSMRLGSMQVIFAGRATDGAGRPARCKSVIATSEDYDSFSALVTIATQIKPWIASLWFETTSAGRRFSASRSA